MVRPGVQYPDSGRWDGLPQPAKPLRDDLRRLEKRNAPQKAFIQGFGLRGVSGILFKGPLLVILHELNGSRARSFCFRHLWQTAAKSSEDPL